MARSYVAEILTVCPDGPYQFVGDSLGGTLAYEAARQLLARTGRAALVVVIDTEPTYPDFDHHELPAQAVAEFALEIPLPTERMRGLDRQAILRLIYDEAVRRKVITYDSR
jgi:thioesterase domain-containing protein